MKCIVQYTLEVRTLKEAEGKAQALCNQGNIWWQDTPKEARERAKALRAQGNIQQRAPAYIPVILDGLKEKQNDSVFGEDVEELKRREAAFRAARLLVEAYQRGEEDGGSVDWDDLDQAYEAALGATQDGESAC